MYVCMYVCVCVLSTFSNILSSETTGPIDAKFHVEPPYDGGTKVYSNEVTRPRWPTCSYMVKTLKNLLLSETKGL